MEQLQITLEKPGEGVAGCEEGHIADGSREKNVKWKNETQARRKEEQRTQMRAIKTKL